MNNKKIVFFTYHNWKTKRQGGFHKFAEIFLKKAYHVFFFSSPRPLYSFFKNDERLNRKSLIDLNKGITFEKFNGLLENITIPTLDLPSIIKNRVNAKLDFYFMNFSLKNKSKYFLERFSDVHVFVFESCLGILYYPLIKKLFPSAKIFYRPSDPLIANRNLNPKIIEIEEKI